MRLTGARALAAGPPVLGPALTLHKGGLGGAQVALRQLDLLDRRAWVASRGSAPVRNHTPRAHQTRAHPAAAKRVTDDTWPMYLNQIRRQSAQQLMFTWAITADQAVVGQAQLVLPNPAAGKTACRIDLWVGHDHRRRGIATTTTELLTNYASELRIRRIEALAAANDVAAVTIATHTGWSVATLTQGPMQSVQPGPVHHRSRHLLLSKELL